MLVHEALELDASEASDLATALHQVNELYDFGLISPKAAAWSNLLMCAGRIYGPRAYVIFKSGKKKSAANQLPVDPQQKGASVN